MLMIDTPSTERRITRAAGACAALTLALALSGCQMASPEVADLPPEGAAQALSAEGAWDSSEDVPSEFSDAGNSAYNI